MTREEEVVQFLRKNRARDYCVICLSETLLSRRLNYAHTRIVIATLGLTSQYNRGRRKCFHCQRLDVSVVRFL
jgi:hypothetical protein